VDLSELNALTPADAERELLRCCGSTRWARAMTEARPFASLEELSSTADTVWASLERRDWIEAFEAHPKIGGAGQAGRDGEHGDTQKTAAWSAAEQAGVAGASRDVIERLAEANREYEARFGYIFIVCATGKSADEMLHLLQQRINNFPDAELRIAAEEQRKITQLRLAKLIANPRMITTHVLDTARGMPAAGLSVVLQIQQGTEWTLVGQGVTDANGRLTTLGEGRALADGTYRLVFDTGGYHRSQGVATSFFPDVRITFIVRDASAHYHVPLLLSPFGYTTYRGS
jgi:hydroxyisourate hydrolase